MPCFEKLKVCCCFICPMICPPWPPSIVAKASLFPPSEPGYEIEAKVPPGKQRRNQWLPHLLEPGSAADNKFNDEVRMQLACFVGLDFIVDSHVYCYRLETDYSHQLMCMYIRYTKIPSRGYTILYSHSNSSDNGYMCPYLFMLSRNLRVNVLAYDYSGYGWSTGRPSERNLYRNIESVYKDMLERFHLSAKNVILMGSSIGSCPSIHLACRERVAGIILDSAVRSGMATMTDSDQIMCGKIKPYLNIKKIEGIASPCLLIHGDNDKMIQLHDAKELYERIPEHCKREPLWLVEGEHMDTLRRPESYARMERFISKELRHPQHQLTLLQHQQQQQQQQQVQQQQQQQEPAKEDQQQDAVLQVQLQQSSNKRLVCSSTTVARRAAAAVAGNTSSLVDNQQAASSRRANRIQMSAVSTASRRL